MISNHIWSIRVTSFRIPWESQSSGHIAIFGSRSAATPHFLFAFADRRNRFAMADVMESYLRPKEKGGGIGAGGFDSKKWVWVPHDTEGFVAGEVKSRKGNKVTVQLPNGSVSKKRGAPFDEETFPECGLCPSSVRAFARGVVAPESSLASALIARFDSERRGGRRRHATDEPPEVRKSRRHGLADLSQRSERASQFTPALLLQFDLRKCRRDST